MDRQDFDTSSSSDSDSDYEFKEGDEEEEKKLDDFLQLLGECLDDDDDDAIFAEDYDNPESLVEAWENQRKAKMKRQEEEEQEQEQVEQEYDAHIAAYDISRNQHRRQQRQQQKASAATKRTTSETKNTNNNSSDSATSVSVTNNNNNNNNKTNNNNEISTSAASASAAAVASASASSSSSAKTNKNKNKKNDPAASTDQKEKPDVSQVELVIGVDKGISGVMFVFYKIHRDGEGNFKYAERLHLLPKNFPRDTEENPRTEEQKQQVKDFNKFFAIEHRYAHDREVMGLLRRRAWFRNLFKKSEKMRQIHQALKNIAEEEKQLGMRYVTKIEDLIQQRKKESGDNIIGIEETPEEKALRAVCEVFDFVTEQQEQKQEKLRDQQLQDHLKKFAQYLQQQQKKQKKQPAAAATSTSTSRTEIQQGQQQLGLTLLEEFEEAQQQLEYQKVQCRHMLVELQRIHGFRSWRFRSWTKHESAAQEFVDKNIICDPKSKKPRLNAKGDLLRKDQILVVAGHWGRQRGMKMGITGGYKKLETILRRVALYHIVYEGYTSCMCLFGCGMMRELENKNYNNNIASASASAATASNNTIHNNSKVSGAETKNDEAPKLVTVGDCYSGFEFSKKQAVEARETREENIEKRKNEKKEKEGKKEEMRMNNDNAATSSSSSRFIFDKKTIYKILVCPKDHYWQRDASGAGSIGDIGVEIVEHKNFAARPAYLKPAILDGQNKGEDAAGEQVAGEDDLEEQTENDKEENDVDAFFDELTGTT